jgi:hypothetical protein
MKSCNILKQVSTYLLNIFSGLLIIGFGTPAYADWNASIGTGIYSTQVIGDQEVGTVSLNPVLIGMDLSPSEYNDFMKSSVSMEVSMTDGTWMVDFSLGLQEFESRGLTRLSDGATLRSNMDFDATSGEITVGRQVYRHPWVILGVHGGLRYDRHKLSVDLRRGAITERVKVDESWIDVLIGMSADIPFAEKWLWKNKMNGGFGGSEGTYFLSSGITWQFHSRWSTEAYGDYTAVNYESGNKGDTDGYLYDVDEFIWGINVLFHF